MKNEIIPFKFKGSEVRIITRGDEPWWIASDVAGLLGYSRTSAMTRSLDDDEKGVHIVHTLGGDQEMTIISEAGLYSAILKSRVERAREFKRWITHEVIPAIRKHGAYMTPAAIEKTLSDPDFIIRLATDLKQERARVAELEAAREADAPKVLFADAVAASKTSILVGELAKILKGNGIEVGQNRLFKELRERGYLIKRRGTDWNMPTQRSMELGLFEIKETAVTHSDGHVTVNKTPKVTGKGQAYFVDLFLSESYWEAA